MGLIGLMGIALIVFWLGNFPTQRVGLRLQVCRNLLQ